jgi:hypothetical protein
MEESLKKGLLSMVVKIVYPKESLTLAEQEKTKAPYTLYLYFYSNSSDFEERMEAAWRPGASAEIWHIEYQDRGKLVASKKQGLWI